MTKVRTVLEWPRMCLPCPANKVNLVWVGQAPLRLIQGSSLNTLWLRLWLSFHPNADRLYRWIIEGQASAKRTDVHKPTILLNVEITNMKRIDSGFISLLRKRINCWILSYVYIYMLPYESSWYWSFVSWDTIYNKKPPQKINN